MPSNTIKAIATDDSGIKWIGTEEGLATFDDINWTVYNTSNSSLPNNTVTSVAIDDNGTKWIGTYNGLVAFDGNDWTIYNTSNSGLPSNTVSSIAIEDGITIWIGTIYDFSGSGLAAFDGTNWVVYNISNSGMPDIYVESIAIADNGTKWIGTRHGGLAEFDGIDWTIYNSSNSSLPDNNVRSIAIDEDGIKWICGDGLSCYNEGGIPVSIPNKIQDEQRVKVYPNPTSGNIFISFHCQILSPISIRIFNRNGELVDQFIFQNQARRISAFSIDLSNFPDGIYIIQVQGKEKIESTKVVKL